MKNTLANNFCLLMTALIMLFVSPGSVKAETAAVIDRDVDVAIEKLFASTPSAKKLAKVAKAYLVFPSVIKGGFIIGGQYGVGALRGKDGNTLGYYNTTAASYGLQAGAQSFGYAMFFMTKSALSYLNESSGWEVGVGPSVVVVDEGMATSLTTSTAKDDIYAIFFSQEGLMAGLGVQGSKISKITPDN